MSSSVEVVGVDASKHQKKDTAMDKLAVCLRVPNHKLNSWYKSGSSYLDHINDSTDVIQIAESATRLLQRVRIKATLVAGEIRRSGYRKRDVIESRFSLFDIRHDEIVHVKELEEKIESLTDDIMEHK